MDLDRQNGLGVWRLAFGIWHLALAFGVWRLALAFATFLALALVLYWQWQWYWIELWHRRGLLIGIQGMKHMTTDGMKVF